MIGLWDSAPYDFGATESTALALVGDGSGWTAVGGPAGAATRVRKLAWDCPKPEVLEIRYEDYEFVRARYTVREDALHLSQTVDSARQFALVRRDVTGTDVPGSAPQEAGHGRE